MLICSFESLVTIPIVLYTLIFINAKQEPTATNNNLIAKKEGVLGIIKQTAVIIPKANNIAFLYPNFAI